MLSAYHNRLRLEVFYEKTTSMHPNTYRSVETREGGGGIHEIACFIILPELIPALTNQALPI